jgi:cardiolipin synthase
VKLSRYDQGALAPADYLSLVRIPLGLLFVGVADRPAIGLAALVVAGMTDVLDGWMARRHRPVPDREPHRGDWLDPLCDKIFVAAVVVGLYLARQPPVALLALLLTREILQAAAVLTMRLLPSLHRVSRDYNFKAHPVGKATTVMQFVAAGLLLLGSRLATPAVWVCSALGAASVALYVSRVRELLAREPPAQSAPRSDR